MRVGSQASTLENCNKDKYMWILNFSQANMYLSCMSKLEQKVTCTLKVAKDIMFLHNGDKTRSYEECNHGCFNYIIYTTTKSSFLT